ncbi:Uncharacterised protein [Mycobacteroides abscessus subsp. abscessus]|nr:Uncharacterised protein [Mycobacteroides abscessus subsp. abscessus]
MPRPKSSSTPLRAKPLNRSMVARNSSTGRFAFFANSSMVSALTMTPDSIHLLGIFCPGCNPAKI